MKLAGMRPSRYILFLLLPLQLFLHSCSRQPGLGPAPVPPGWVQQIEEWKQYRIGRLTEPTGWLRLVDLIWLKEGENRFGSGAEMEVRFPEGAIPEFAGVFTLQEGRVRMRVADGVRIFHNGDPVTDLIIYGSEKREEVAGRIELSHGDLTWFVDRRGDQYGIRLFSLDTPRADAFRGFPTWPLDESWHLKAKFHPYEKERTIPVVNVLGEMVERHSPGWVEFEIQGERLRLDAFVSASGYFFIFADETNRSESYQAGRYLIMPPPDEEGNMILDFNRAYNMPCSFSRFTTCQLPPPQNRLPIAITAGEKRPGLL